MDSYLLPNTASHRPRARGSLGWGNWLGCPGHPGWTASTLLEGMTWRGEGGRGWGAAFFPWRSGVGVLAVGSPMLREAPVKGLWAAGSCVQGTGWEAAACMGRPALGLHWTPLGLHPHPFPPACLLLCHPAGSKVRGRKAISHGLAGEQLSGLPASVSRASDLKGSPSSP